MLNSAYFTHCSGALVLEDDDSIVSTSLALSNPIFFPDLYFSTELLLRSACCGSVGRCDLYRQRRPPNNCLFYRPPRFSESLTIIVRFLFISDALLCARMSYILIHGSL